MPQMLGIPGGIILGVGLGYGGWFLTRLVTLRKRHNPAH